MKKIFILLAAVGFATACQKGLVQEPEATTRTGEINFSSRVAATKATDTKFENGDEIAVTAYDEKGEIFERNIKYAYTDGLFTSDEAINVGTTPIELSYASIYPYFPIPESGLLYFDVQTNQALEGNYTKSDLMYGTAAATDNETPELLFSHIQAQVIINVSSDELDLSSAVLNLNAKIGVEYNIKKAACKAIGKSKEITMAKDGANRYKAVIPAQWVQTSEAFATLEVDGYQYNAYFSEDKSLKSGKTYTYDLAINEGKIEFDGEINENKGEKLLAVNSITLVENEHGSLLLDIDKADDYNGSFSVFPALRTDIDAYDGDIQAYVEDYVYKDVFVHKVDHTTVDDKYVFNYDLDDYNLMRWWYIQEYRDYVVIAVGVNTDGTLRTGVTVSEELRLASQFEPKNITVPDVDFGEITLNSQTYTSFNYSVKPADATMPYALLATPMSIFKYYETDEDKFILAIEYLEKELLKENYTLETGLPLIVKTDDLDNVSISELNAGETYAVYCFGLDVKNIQPLTKIEVLAITTDEYAEQTGELKTITFSDITSKNALTTVDAGGYTGNYFVMPVSDETLAYYGGDMTKCLQGALDYNVIKRTDYSETDDVYIFNGDAEFYVGTSWKLDAGTHYTVGAAGVSPSGEIITTAISGDFTTSGAASTSTPQFMPEALIEAPLNNFKSIISYDFALYSADAIARRFL